MIAARNFTGENDLQQMENMLMQARSLTNDWHYAHVGELAFNFFMVAIHLEPQEHIRLWYDDERLIGYAMLGEDPAFDFQFLPAYEWSGLEEEALAWVELRIGELCRQDRELWGGELVSGSRVDNPQRIAFLERHGFRYRGDFAEVNMLRWLDEPIPDFPLPAGFQVREVREGELSNRAAAQQEVWQPWTVGNVSEQDYAHMMRLPGYDRWLDIVAVTPEGVIAAYVNGWLDSFNRIGDFGPLGALPAYRRQGLTRLVLLEGLRRMQARGMQRVCVSTGVTNTPARLLYESIGFKIVNRYLDYVRPA